MVSRPDDRFQSHLQAARHGHPDALTELLGDYAADLRRSLDIAPKWASALDTDDVLQVTFVEAFLRIGHFAGNDPMTFRAWLRRIAQNNLRTAIRGLSRDKRPHPDKRLESPVHAESYVALCDVLGVTTSTPSRAVSIDEARTLIDGALDRLPPDYAAAIRLFDLQGCNGPQAAEQLGRSRGAAFMLLARARDCLRDLLGSESMFFTDNA